jgi:D-glycero-D-manno-heptose 1,7-bisphosphate phosphatase
LRLRHVPGWLRRRCALPEDALTRPAVFLDRDGTISEEVGYLNDASHFRMFPFTAAAIRRLNEAELPVIVVTNQSGVGRGFFPESSVHSIHELMQKQLLEAGARVDAIYYCPHSTEHDCECRKPKPGMLAQAAREHGLDLRRSFVVGDRYGDVNAAHNAGARGILVRTGYGEVELTSDEKAWPAPPDLIADDLRTAVDWILREVQ